MSNRASSNTAGADQTHSSTAVGEGPLLAVSLTDVLADGLSMVYSFFEPDASDRSLGTFMILDHIERARRLGLPYLYLGYWVEGSQQDGLQSPIPAAGTAWSRWLGNHFLMELPKEWIPFIPQAPAHTNVLASNLAEHIRQNRCAENRRSYAFAPDRC